MKCLTAFAHYSPVLQKLSIVFLLLFPSQPTFPVNQGLGTSPVISYTPYITPMTHGMGLVSTEMLPSTQVIMPGSPPVTVQSAPSSSPTQKALRSDKLEVLTAYVHSETLPTQLCFE